MLKFWKHDAQMLNNCAASAIKQSNNPQDFRLKQRVRRLQASAMAEHGALATGETVHKKTAALRAGLTTTRSVPVVRTRTLCVRNLMFVLP